MRIELRERGRRNWRCVGQASLDPADRPTKLLFEPIGLRRGGEGRDVFLNWDGALDDAGQLRKCVICGCSEMFHEKAFPQTTGIVIVLAFAGAAAGVFGYVNPLILTAMIIVLAMDVAILVFSKRRLVCYRCRSSYHDLPVARYHRRWERAVGERYAQPRGVTSPSFAPPVERAERTAASPPRRSRSPSAVGSVSL